MKTRMPPRIIFVSLFLALSCTFLTSNGVSLSASPVQKFRVRTHGVFGSILTCELSTQLGPLCSQISFNRDNLGGAPATFLYLDAYAGAPDGGFYHFSGSGAIPSGDLVGDTPGQAIPRGLELRTSVNDNQGEIVSPDGFVLYLATKCSADAEPVCEPLSMTGEIVVKFDSNGLHEIAQQGSMRSRTRLPDGSYRNFHTNGIARTQSASAYITLFGLPIASSPMDAQMGISNGMEITIEKTGP